ncbi:SAM-dependent methyltransferase [Microcoleus sp. FACHB-SPT15]|uniref:class I SAM-dependent methyltransferase n=1 Tax=Microcoleus sp. FACHB-SPT15 TaxID=2692830 RepID=UPI00177B0876|nr:class I SAM-dependent methyltransferase [Microcoleus sp. FACHB-SPT15]MBD1806647.1 SAM-dependent methyltransferase [Microcoleus sp. FACHB-SPT15]
MGFQLEKVIPWGRSMEEYVKMFNLTPDELQLNILDCAGGPASFNAEMKQQGYEVISCDPIYQFSAGEIAQRIQDTYQSVIDGVQATREYFVWQDIQSPEHLGQIRMAAMQKFLEDLPLGIQQGRYITAELPTLPFDSDRFDLALCSHLLFTYSDLLSQEFHLASIRELCRVATQVRIFPLLNNFSTEVSPLVGLVMKELTAQGYNLEIQQVSYEFQKGGNQMLQVQRGNIS